MIYPPLLIVTLAAALLSPAETRQTFETSDHVQLSYKISGTGEPCLFVHGGPGQGFRSFERLGGQNLEPFVEMIYLDQRGSGLSEGANDYSLDRVVQDFEELRSRLGLNRWCLIAHSFGGTLATAYAHRYPEHVSKIVLVNTSLNLWGPYRIGHEIEFMEGILQEEHDPNENDILFRREELRSRMFKEGFGYLFLTDNLETLRIFNETDNYPRELGYGRAVVGGRMTLPEYYRDLAPLTAQLNMPVHVIAGTDDHAVGPKEHERYLFPNMTVDVIDGGHLLYYEKSVEFLRSVRHFFEPHPKN